MMSRNTALALAICTGLLAATAAMASPKPADIPTSCTLAGATQAECPADWDRGSRDCKKARAERKCPELKGGKCQAKQDSGATAMTAPLGR